MKMNLHISNLSFAVREVDLRDLFVRYGPVTAIHLVLDGSTGHSRGFGFVEMAREHAMNAIRGLHGKIVEGKAMIVAEARSRSAY